MIRAFIKRILPNHADQIDYSYIESENGKDLYEIDWKNNKLVLRGNTPVSLAAALGHYLKYTAKINISWCGSHFQLPKELPKPEPYRCVIDQKYRVYMNYCTFQYSAAWWDFDRWEKEIDFMALNGINMPLCAVGIEAVWYETLLELGFQDMEARTFLAGPAFLAWQWMTNLEGFGGPLPKSWIKKRLTLGKKILQRQLDFGMYPIQQGFSGYVPKALMEKYPNSKIQLQKSWCGMEPTAQLDPTDPLFQKIGTIFLQKQKELFGNYGFYAADPFHEGAPPQEDEDYLKKVGESIAGLFRSFDANYCWVMQAWSIRKEIACAVPKDKLLILDLNGTAYQKNDDFWGYHFITGNLHNFGGRTKLHGDLALLAENQYLKLKSKQLSVCGTGLFMEGIYQNPVYYDLAFEMLTSDTATDITAWLNRYAERRYHSDAQTAKEAWQLLLRTAYAPGTNGVESSSVICARPAVRVKKSGPNNGFVVSYGNKRLVKAYQLLRRTHSTTDGYAYDLTDIMRQILSNYAFDLYTEVSQSFLNREKETFQRLSNQFLTLLEDIDDLLSCRPEFSFENWIADACRFGETDSEKRLYDYNATALVTIWGPDENPEIFDYSWREWSGLISQYYKIRWAKFFTMLSDCLDKDTEYIEEGLPLIYGREAWRANDFYNELADWEVNWIHSKKHFIKKNLCLNDVLDRLESTYFDKLR